MILRVSISFLILWSSFARSDNLVPDLSKKIPTEVFNPPKNFQFNAKIKVIENMPKIQSSDTVNSCIGCAPSIIAQKFYCDTDENIKKSKIACSNLPANQQISQLSMVAWVDTNEGTSTTTKGLGEVNSHKNIRLYGDTNKKILKGSQALKNSSRDFEFMPESCYPMDILVNKYGESEPLFQASYARLTNIYNSRTEAGHNCNDCLEKVKNELFKDPEFPGVDIDLVKLNRAFSRKTFGEFLYTLLFANCRQILIDKKPTYKQLSELKKSEVLNNMITILNADKPFLVNSLCSATDASKKFCTSLHTVVISGYRLVCPTENLQDVNCKYQLQLHNCWGMEWQNKLNGGWIDADKIIKHLNYGYDFIETADISWLE